MTEALRLVQNADIIIENFRPGVMARLGLGAEALLARHPRLIYCSLPGLRPRHPRASVRAFEGVVGSGGWFVGTASVAATRKRASSRRADFGTSAAPRALPLSLQRIPSWVAALIARRRTGRGQCIEVPLFDAAFWHFSRPVVRHGR